MRARSWVAAFRWGAQMPGGYTVGGSREAMGTTTIHLKLTDSAGIHAGRDIAFVIQPQDLDSLASLIGSAIKARDGRKGDDR